MLSTGYASRDVGADGARPSSPLHRLIGLIGEASDAVGRWAWLWQYQRAESRYWSAHGRR